MAVLVNQYKKIQYLIDSLVLPFIKTQHPKWRELILVYLQYLDDYSLNKAMNITDNVNVNNMYSELLDDFLNLYFKDVVDLNKFGLNDDNKRLFIALSKLIHNLKATKTSFGFFFNSFTDFSIPTDTGDISVNDLIIELAENPNWWLLNNDPTRPFTYVFKVNVPDLTNLRDLISEVHPSGWVQLFLYEVEFDDYMNGLDCLELTVHYGVKYNGKHKYDGTQIIEGLPYPLKYNGGVEVNDPINCNDLPIASEPVVTHALTSDILGYDQFYPLAGSDQWENIDAGDEWFDLDVDGTFNFLANIVTDLVSDSDLTVWGDDFTGTNGNPPNTTYWTVVETNGGACEINNNKLRCENPGLGGADEIVQLESNFYMDAINEPFGTVYDIQVDFDWVSFTPGVVGTRNEIWLREITGTDYAFVRVENGSSTWSMDLVVNGSRRHLIQPNGTKALDYTKLRVTVEPRSGTSTLFTGYLWDISLNGGAGDWEQLGGPFGITAMVKDFNFEVMIRKFNRDNVEKTIVDYDNFKINSGASLIWP